jgi:hypothetical protein
MKMHLTVSIKGLEERLILANKKKGVFWQILQYEDGTPLTVGETWNEIQRCKKLGYEVIPTCDNVDKKGHCNGHEEK